MNKGHHHVQLDLWIKYCDPIIDALCIVLEFSVLDGFGRIVADLNDFVGFEWISVHLGDLGFYDWAGFGWIWADFCRFGWICLDSRCILI